MALIVRPVTPADISAVRVMLIDTWHATYDSLYGAAKVADITSRWHNIEALSAQIAQPDSQFLLTEEDGHVRASSYAARLGDEDAVQLYRLYVHPRAQGRALMNATLAPFEDVAVQRLEVEPRNRQAITFYEREGFRLAGSIPDCGGSSGIEALVYERTRA
jgi:ribosomal protein S18 acetylase RimI-like enzyme